MGCLEISVRRVGEMSVSATNVGRMKLLVNAFGRLVAAVNEVCKMSCSAREISDYKVRVGLVCSTNIGGDYGIIWASDGRLITLEGGYLIQA